MRGGDVLSARIEGGAPLPLPAVAAKGLLAQGEATTPCLSDAGRSRACHAQWRRGPDPRDVGGTPRDPSRRRPRTVGGGSLVSDARALR